MYIQIDVRGKGKWEDNYVDYVTETDVSYAANVGN